MVQGHTVLTKNQCFCSVSASKKKPEPASAWVKKSAARVAIQWNIEKPALLFNTNNAIACWRKRPTMTVGLANNQHLTCDEKSVTDHGIAFLLLEVSQKPHWKIKSPKTEMARSPYVVFCTQSQLTSSFIFWSRTSCRGKPKAEPKTIANKQIHPSPSLVRYESL